MKTIQRANFNEFVNKAAYVCGTTMQKFYGGFYYYVEECSGCPNLFKNPNNGNNRAIDQLFDIYSEKEIAELMRQYIKRFLEINGTFPPSK